MRLTKITHDGTIMSVDTEKDGLLSLLSYWLTPSANEELLEKKKAKKKQKKKNSNK
jgi:hypothetical protein